MRKTLLKLFRTATLLSVGLCFYQDGFAQYSTAASYPFTTYTTTYTPISGGNSVSILSDDITQTSIPLGFNFPFCGSSYSQVSVCSNGWLSFANTSTTSLSNGSSSLSGITPAIMPLWEDLSGSGGSAYYQTTGSAPNRVFTMEWLNWKWNYNASGATISFQVKLYEDGQIECIYRQESGSIVTSSGGASIGIAASSTDWQVLDNSSTSPTPSTSSFTTNILTKPATGQVYKWGEPPCSNIPTSVTSSNVSSTSATVSWSIVNPTLYTEYAFTTSSTPPSSGTQTNGTSYTASNLTPNTQYYFHIRNQCTSNSKTLWVTLPVKTNPPCTVPTGFHLLGLGVDSARVAWRKLGHASNYEYVVDQDTNDPISTTPVTSTTDTAFTIKQLTEGITYYIHIRAKCPGGEMSDWLLDSFTTLIVCRAPQLKVDNIDADRAIVYWDPVRTAVKYEYEISTSSTPLGKGTTIEKTSFLAYPLKDNQTYYFHVRSRCVDQGINNSSDWATATFTTFPTSVNNTNKDGFAFVAYPNPVKDVLTVKVTGQGIAANASVMVMDMAGRVLYSIAVANNNAIEIDMSHFANGVYMVKYSDGARTETIRTTKY